MIPNIDGENMQDLTTEFREDLRDAETRSLYADEFLNAYIATQIKVLREREGWTQAQLAEKAGMKQERISVLEDIDYSAWTANVLKRLARAFALRLSIKIESFGSLVDEFSSFGRETLLRQRFEEDPAFRREDSISADGIVGATSRRVPNRFECALAPVAEYEQQREKARPLPYQRPLEGGRRSVKDNGQNEANAVLPNLKAAS